MNATGDSDIRTWYDRVKSQQVKKLRPPIEMMVRTAFATLGYEEPESWSIEFHPLWQPTEKEQADTQGVIATVDTANTMMGAYTAEEVRKHRFSGRKFNSSPMKVIGDLPEPNVDEAQSPEYQKLKQKIAQVPGAAAVLVGPKAIRTGRAA